MPATNMAKAQIDVYRDWLGITDVNRPLTYYQLLKLPAFTDDSGAVRKAYRDLNVHVRKYASGEYSVESQSLLNELAKAMLCLTDAVRKMEYDASLGRKAATVKARRSLEDILLLNNIVPQDRMKQVKGYADAVGIDLQEAVLQQKISNPEIVMLAYAESIGLPFVSIDDIGVDEEYAPQINPNTARMHSFVPLTADRGVLILASPKPVNPDVEEELRMVFDMPVRSAICTPAQANAAIAKYYPKDAVQLIAKKGGAATAPANKAPAKKSQVAAEPEVELSPEEAAEKKKQRQQSAIVGFCMTCALLGGGGAATGYAVKVGMLFYPLVFLLAAAVAGVTWVVMGKK